MAKALVYKVTVPSALEKEAIKNGLLSVINKSEVEFVGFSEVPELVETAQTAAAPAEAYQPKRLIKFRCPDCGKVNVKMCIGDFNVTCRGCEKEYDFPLECLVRAEFTCPECGADQYFWMPDEMDFAINADFCRICKHEVTLAYSQERNRYEAF